MRLSKEQYRQMEGIVQRKQCTESAAIIAQGTRLFVETLIGYGVPDADSYKIARMVAVANPYNLDVDAGDHFHAAEVMAVYISCVWIAHKALGFTDQMCTDLVCVMF